MRKLSGSVARSQVSPYLAVRFMVGVIVIISSARSSGRTRADDA